MSKKKEYDPGLMGRAISGLGLRVLVAVYIVYMAWKVLSGVLNGSSPIPEWIAWTIFSVFAAAALAFCIYAVKQFLLLLKSAVISPAQQINSLDSETHGESDLNDSDKH
ncbi:MAG: hypothetical protein KBI01_10865 [Oscillospiraceae bacterium]|nr:hypothetical protein [Oscillospiraceae bacterium]